MESAFLVSPSYDAFANLAAERKLLERPVADVTLMLWRNSPVVVVSAQQDAQCECRLEEAAARGVQIARRASGGGAVYHDLGNLNFSFICRCGHYDEDRQLGVVADALRKFGIVAEATGRNDLGAGGLKFSGSAYYHLHGVGCHHGTLMVDCDIATMEALLTPGADKLARHGAVSVKSRVVNLVQLNPAIAMQSLIDELQASFHEEYGAPLRDVAFPAVGAAEAARWVAVEGGENVNLHIDNIM